MCNCRLRTTAVNSSSSCRASHILWYAPSSSKSFLLLQIGLGNVSLILPFGILWEPSLSDALPLFEKFQDTPEAGAADYAEDRAQDSVLHQKAGSYEKCAGKGKYPPALG